MIPCKDSYYRFFTIHGHSTSITVTAKVPFNTLGKERVIFGNNNSRIGTYDGTQLERHPLSNGVEREARDTLHYFMAVALHLFPLFRLSGLEILLPDLSFQDLARWTLGELTHREIIFRNLEGG